MKKSKAATLIDRMTNAANALFHDASTNELNLAMYEYNRARQLYPDFPVSDMSKKRLLQIARYATRVAALCREMAKGYTPER